MDGKQQQQQQQSLKPGDWVRLVGLTGSVDLNGETGVFIDVDPDDLGRYVVKMDETRTSFMALKIKNLEKVTDIPTIQPEALKDAAAEMLHKLRDLDPTESFTVCSDWGTACFHNELLALLEKDGVTYTMEWFQNAEHGGVLSARYIVYPQHHEDRQSGWETVPGQTLFTWPDTSG